MKKNAVIGGVILVILLAVFQVVAFVVPHTPSGTYWVGYAFTTAAFLLQAAFAFTAFYNARRPEQKFLGLSVFRLGVMYLVLQVIWGVICLFVTAVATWVAVVVSVILLGLYLVMTAAAIMARGEVEAASARTEAKTAMIRNLTSEMTALASRAKTDAEKEDVRRVQEALRYSDPVSGPGLAEIERQLKSDAEALAKLVEAGDSAAVHSQAEQLLQRLKERNELCKRLK